jgi:hypothetical protein
MGFLRGPYIQRGGRIQRGRIQRQRGRGLGSLFGSLFRSAVPILKSLGGKILNSSLTKSVGKTLVESATEGGLTLAKDALRGNNLGQSVKASLGKTRAAVADAISQHQQQNSKKTSSSKSAPRRRRTAPVKVARGKRKPAVKSRSRASLFDDTYSSEGEDESSEDDDS